MSNENENKIVVKLNPLTGARSYQDPTDETNLIFGDQIAEFNDTGEVGKIIAAGGLIKLHPKDEEVIEYFKKKKEDEANKANAKPAAASLNNEKIGELVQAHLELEAEHNNVVSQLDEANVKLEKLADADEALKNATAEKQLAEDAKIKAEEAKKATESDLELANKRIAELEAEVKNAKKK